jgi:nucleoside-diphosphate-sugar epimerase
MRFERVIVTGGSGRLGRFVVDELVGACAPTVLDIAPPLQEVPYIEADILDSGAVRAAVEGYDAMIHLAGYDDGMAPDEKGYVETNIQGAWNVLHAAEEAGLRKVVVASSFAALGLGYGRMPDYLPVDESHPLRPTKAYGLSKQVIETVARHFVRRGRLEIVCLRPTLIVRPEREAAILAQLALPDPDSDAPAGTVGPGGVEPAGALSPTRGYVRSVDAARCFRFALDHEGDAFDIFNVAAGDTIGRVETLKRLEDVFGRVPDVRDPALYAGDPHAGALSVSRVRDVLGWEVEGDWQGIAARHGAG